MESKEPPIETIVALARDGLDLTTHYKVKGSWDPKEIVNEVDAFLAIIRSERNTVCAFVPREVLDDTKLGRWNVVAYIFKRRFEQHPRDVPAWAYKINALLRQDCHRRVPPVLRTIRDILREAAGVPTQSELYQVLMTKYNIEQDRETLEYARMSKRGNVLEELTFFHDLFAKEYVDTPVTLPSHEDPWADILRELVGPNLGWCETAIAKFQGDSSPFACLEFILEAMVPLMAKAS